MRGMNKFASTKRAQIIPMLCEGSSMNSIMRVVDLSANTVEVQPSNGSGPIRDPLELQRSDGDD